MDELPEYEKVRDDTRSLYNDAKPVYSPALNENIYFTSEGFNHLIFKAPRKERDRSSQMMRFKLVPRAIRLIEHANTFQEFEETIREFEVKTRKKRVKKSKSVRYWGIIAIFEGRKIKIILRKIGEGQMHFWSVIPSWTTNKHRDTKFISTMKGNPDED